MDHLVTTCRLALLTGAPNLRVRQLSPRDSGTEQLIVRLGEKNRDWGYDRIAGALANLGYGVCDQTVDNVLQRHGLPPAPERKRTTTWSAFIATQPYSSTEVDGWEQKLSRGPQNRPAVHAGAIGGP